MSRRLHATLADYVIVAINPALIMVLIGSLVYFLLEMFYQGQYPARLHYCLSWYIFGAVLVSRVSMEEGWDHAAPLGAALAIVMVIALHRFVSYEGTRLAAIGWLINYALIGLISWCAHKLTWDCTLIDDSQDASGEGLLQTAGLDSHDAKSEITAKTEMPKSSSKTADDALPAIAVESNQSSAAARASGKFAKKSWWQQFVERRRRPHAPGVWIIYFSLAALPLFGFGQVFIPASNTASRRYAFVLLSIYVACGLGLLLTTSFLGLRRYLRQRKLEMPATMTGTWLATGAVLIVGLLLFSALLPRPNAEYAISQLPTIASKHRDSSGVSVGKEGTKDDHAKSASGKRSRPEDEQQRAPNAKSNGTERGPENANKDAAGPNEDGKQGGSNGPSDDQSQNEKSSTGQSEENSASKSDSHESNSKGSDSSSEKQSESDQDSAGSKPSESKPEQPADGEQPNDDQKSAEEKDSPSESSGQSPQSSPPEPNLQPPDVAALGGSLVAILKWIFYGALIAAALWWSWRNREQLLAWLRSLLTFWRDLFGSRQRKLPETIQLAPIHRPFSAYADPFAAGIAGRYPPAELVRYSFEAFEAWARDQGWPRDTDQTAYEFARNVGSHVPHIAASARTLAELYSRAAYAPGTLPASSVEHLRSLWQAMQAPQLVV